MSNGHTPNFAASNDASRGFERLLRQHLGLQAKDAVPWSFALSAVVRELEQRSKGLRKRIADFNESVRDASRREDVPELDRLLQHQGNTEDQKSELSKVTRDIEHYRRAQTYAQLRENFDRNLKDRFSAWMRNQMLGQLSKIVSRDRKFKNLKVRGNYSQHKIALTYVFKTIDRSRLPKSEVDFEIAVAKSHRHPDPPWVSQAENTVDVLYIDWERSEIRDTPRPKEKDSLWTSVGKFILTEVATTILLGGVLKAAQLAVRGVMRIRKVRRAVQSVKAAADVAAAKSLSTAKSIVDGLRKAVPQRRTRQLSRNLTSAAGKKQAAARAEKSALGSRGTGSTNKGIRPNQRGAAPRQKGPTSIAQSDEVARLRKTVRANRDFFRYMKRKFGLKPRQVLNLASVTNKRWSSQSADPLMRRLAQAWESMVENTTKQALTRANARSRFNYRRTQFWKRVRDEDQFRDIKQMFETRGFMFPTGPKGRTTPYFPLGPKGRTLKTKTTGRSSDRIELSIDHIDELNRRPGRALDADNFRIEFERANTVLNNKIERFHDKIGDEIPLREVIRTLKSRGESLEIETLDEALDRALTP